MITGASTASVSLILIDARNGIVEQTARHYSIACLLRIANVIVCVNKMDLVSYDQTRFDAIVADFRERFATLTPPGQHLRFLPIAALHGDNITRVSDALPWYAGPALLDMFEALDDDRSRALPARLQVQAVIRARRGGAELGSRAYAGRVASGVFAVGDDVRASPRGRESVITAIERLGVPIDRAHAGQSIAIRLADEIDIGRGAWLMPVDATAPAQTHLHAQLCWLDHAALDTGKTYLLQHGIARVRAKIAQIEDVLDMTTGQRVARPARLNLNEIGGATLRLAQPIFADAYADNPATGAFILIDEWSNTTAGVGLVG
jgi:sulfate adenylyltransferase subunit 1